MSRYNAQKPLQTLSPVLDDFVGEAVGEHLAREWWDVHPRRFVFEDVAEGLKVRIAPPD